MFSVYKITNKHNNKIYIGCTTRDINRRFAEHFRDAFINNKRYKKRHFYNAIRKYGRNNFTIELLGQYKSFDDMLKAEASFINLFDSTNHNIGYNSTYGGRQARMTDEVKKKIAETMMIVQPFKGRIHTEESKLKQRKIKLGKKMSDESKAKISKAHSGEKHWSYGKPRSEKTRYKIAIANTGKKMSNASKAKMSSARKAKTFKNNNAKSKYYGVSYRGKAACKPWMVRIILPGSVRKYIGVFEAELVAAEAYNNYVIENKLDLPLNLL